MKILLVVLVLVVLSSSAYGEITVAGTREYTGAPSQAPGIGLGGTPSSQDADMLRYQFTATAADGKRTVVDLVAPTGTAVTDLHTTVREQLGVAITAPGATPVSITQSPGDFIGTDGVLYHLQKPTDLRLPGQAGNLPDGITFIPMQGSGDTVTGHLADDSVSNMVFNYRGQTRVLYSRVGNSIGGEVGTEQITQRIGEQGQVDTIRQFTAGANAGMTSVLRSGGGIDNIPTSIYDDKLRNQRFSVAGSTVTIGEGGRGGTLNIGSSSPDANLVGFNSQPITFTKDSSSETTNFYSSDKLPGLNVLTTGTDGVATLPDGRTVNFDASDSSKLTQALETENLRIKKSGNDQFVAEYERSQVFGGARRRTTFSLTGKVDAEYGFGNNLMSITEYSLGSNNPTSVIKRSGDTFVRTHYGTGVREIVAPESSTGSLRDVGSVAGVQKAFNTNPRVLIKQDDDGNPLFASVTSGQTTDDVLSNPNSFKPLKKGTNGNYEGVDANSPLNKQLDNELWRRKKEYLYDLFGYQTLSQLQQGARLGTMLSNILYEEDKFKSWKNQVDEIFNNQILGGSQFYIASVCDKWIKRMPSNVGMIETANGEMITAAAVSAEKQTIDVPGEASFIYKIEYIVNIPKDKLDDKDVDRRRRLVQAGTAASVAPQRNSRFLAGGSGASSTRMEEYVVEGPFFNVVLYGTNNNQTFLFRDSGSNQRLDLPMKEGSAARGKNMILRQSEKNYVKICVEFYNSNKNPKPLDFPSGSRYQFCKDIAESQSAAARVPRGVVPSSTSASPGITTGPSSGETVAGRI